VSDRERDERVPEIVALAKGAKGEQGQQGERGEQGMTPGARRAVVYLFALSLLLGGLNLLFTAREVNQLRAATRSACQFAADLAGAPVVASPAGKASRLGVSIVSDSRQQWRGLGCPGRLAPPAPSFVKWARYYHLPSR
jgi:hypothetical protein